MFSYHHRAGLAGLIQGPYQRIRPEDWQFEQRCDSLAETSSLRVEVMSRKERENLADLRCWCCHVEYFTIFNLELMNRLSSMC